MNPVKFFITTFFITLFFTCKTSKNAETMENPGGLFQEWKVSNEESSDEILILRPSEYDFPPSRLREEFIFHKDHTLIYKTLDAVDLPLTKKGRWEWADENMLKITIGEDNILFWQVIKLNENKLEVKQ